MPIKALEKKERQKILALVFIILLFLTFLVIFFGISGRKEVKAPIIPLEAKKVEINFEVLESPLLKELQIFEEISLIEEKGRDNPFLPYETVPLPSE